VTVGREPPFRGDLSTEADESPLLEVVTRESPVKIMWVGEGLAGAVVICKLWRLAVAL
jgi:hypothetical protein